jgi:UDP-N-acetylmuramate--alanine ligase
MSGRPEALGQAGVPLGLSPGTHIHLVGIGGIGLSAIARVLLHRSYEVSGSDLGLTPITCDLAELGATIREGHRAQNVNSSDLVIVSSAVPKDNVEVEAARAASIPVLKRGEALVWLMRDRCGVAVAGTHGKTTVTAMIGLLLLNAGLDPTIIVGGIVPELHSNARDGTGPHFVVEADEYDRTFLELAPGVAVVTSIEMDHPDCYHDLEDLVHTFTEFLEKVPPDGLIVACGDDPRVREAIGRIRGPGVVTYGSAPNVHWRATDLEQNALGGTDFSVSAAGEDRGRFQLRIPGAHNVSNALAALAVGAHLGVDASAALETLRDFQGVARRFEVKGDWQGTTVVDDYAHHPSEVKATLAGARQRFDGRRIWVVFQPHTYSRTKALLSEFATAFDDADRVIVTPIYGAREHDDLGVQASDLVEAMSHLQVTRLPDLSQIASWLSHRIAPGDVVITMGAGDVWTVGEELLSLPESEGRSDE